MPILDAKLLDTDPRGCELLAALLAGRRRRPDDHPALSGHALRWKAREAAEWGGSPCTDAIRMAAHRMGAHSGERLGRALSPLNQVPAFRSR